MVAVVFLLSSIATVDHTNALKGAELYEALYKAGYGSEGTMLHYHSVLAEVKSAIASNGHVKSVLDVGCSHGGGVKALWDLGITASGVDISPTAIALARKRHGDRPGKCIGTCWQAASAISLPFANSSFDAIMSTTS